VRETTIDGAAAMIKSASNAPSKHGRRAALLALAALLLQPAWAQQQTPPPAGSPAPADVSVALVLAVDTSGSVSMGRFELQKQGYAAAFRNPQVLNAIRSLGTQSVAATMFQWTGPLLHVVVADWTLIKDQASAAAFAGAIEAAPRRLFGGGTSISGAIDYARVLLAQSPYKGARRIIDVSGDGSNNSGRPATMARDEAVADGVGINGLPILTVEPGLDQYYHDNVIGGPGAFMIPAANYDNFADAILKKLINEIAAREPGDQIIVRQTSQTRPSLREDSASSEIPTIATAQ
jgi:Protein of unknown function (DUF1194)